MSDTHDRPELKPILVAVDLTPASADVLAFALNLSECTGAPLTVMHAVHEPAYDPGFYRRGRAMHRSVPMQTLAKHMLDELIERECVDGVASRMGGELRTVLTDGLPATRILDVANRDDVAMIVLGSHGRSGAARMVLGSVVDDVSRQSRVPVTIVKSTWMGWESSPLEEEGENEMGARAVAV